MSTSKTDFDFYSPGARKNKGLGFNQVFFLDEWVLFKPPGDRGTFIQEKDWEVLRPLYLTVQSPDAVSITGSGALHLQFRHEPGMPPFFNLVLNDKLTLSLNAALIDHTNLHRAAGSELATLWGLSVPAFGFLYSNLMSAAIRAKSRESVPVRFVVT